MNKKRPVNLDISTIKLPVTAYASILHRFSGIFLFAGAAVLLWMLDSSLDSRESFAAVRDASGHPVFKVVLWAVLSALAYHTITGIRHIIMDFGVGESLEGGKRGATIALILAAVLIVLIGVWLW